MKNTRLNHINYFLSEINRERIENINCDCTIKIDDFDIQAHQFMLELASPTLGRLIQEIKKSQNSPKIIIKLTQLTNSCKYFPKILEFIYSGKIDINEREIFGIIELSATLEMSFLVNFCCKTFSELLTIENINYIYKKSLTLKQTILREICLSFFCLNLYNCNLSREIPLADVNKILSDPRLIMWNSKEEIIFTGHQYLRELLKILLDCCAVSKTTVNADELSLQELKKSILSSINTIRIDNESPFTTFSSFINTKYYAVPSNLTCPAGRYLPFGMHPFQSPDVSYRISLCSENVLNTIGDCSADKWKLKKITFYIIRKWNNLCKVVAGIDCTYHEIWNENSIKVIQCHLENPKKYRIKELLLKPMENITKVKITHSWVINSFTFKTDHGNIFGPFGDPHPVNYQVQITEIDIQKHGSRLLYLHGFHYIDIMSCGWRLCNQLSLECAMINTQRLEHDFQNIIDHVKKDISTHNDTSYNIESSDRDTSINIINMRPFTFNIDKKSIKNQ